MNQKLRLMCVLAHPDDESLGTGGTLAKYASQGIDTFLVTATRGERGRFGKGIEFPGFESVGKMREAELLAASKELGIREVSFLDYIDGDLDHADTFEAVARIASHLRRVRPHVVITFGPEGAYGHPDHIAISQFTTAAIVCAANTNGNLSEELSKHPVPHCVSKLYYIAWTRDKWSSYQSVFRDLKIKVDGVERKVVPWPDWGVTTLIDTRSYWPSVWRAVSCHKTQLEIYGQLEHLPEKHHATIWGTQEYYRAFSLVNAGRTQEKDLFEGLR